MTEILLSGLAKELKCSPGSLTRLVKIRTLELLPSGKIDRTRALKAISLSTSGAGGGWGNGMRGGKLPLRERAQALLTTPKRHRQRAKASDDSERLQHYLDYGYGHGMAHLARCLRHPGRIKTMGQVAHEAIGITKADGCNLAKINAHLVGDWIVDLLAETAGPEYSREFQEELDAWVAENIPYAPEEKGK